MGARVHTWVPNRCSITLDDINELQEVILFDPSILSWDLDSCIEMPD